MARKAKTEKPAPKQSVPAPAEPQAQQPPQAQSGKLLANIGCQLPDEVWSLAQLDRYQRSRSNADFCTLDESRHFIRCVLAVPFSYQDGFFGWGLWVEVSKQDHDAYVEFNRGKRELDGYEFTGKLANNLKAYRPLLGVQVGGRFSVKHRPHVSVAAGSQHRLARESREGLDAARYQEIMDHYRQSARAAG